MAEDRTLDGQPLLPPAQTTLEAARTARERYAAHYSTARLRGSGGQDQGAATAICGGSSNFPLPGFPGGAAFVAVREHLALPVLGSLLWSPDSTAARQRELTNHDFLEALRHLAFTRQGKVLRPVDYRNLGAEELGGVYESLLALTLRLTLRRQL